MDYFRTYATTTTGQRERQKSISQTTTWHVHYGLFVVVVVVVVVHFFAVIARPRHETGMLLKRGTASGERKNEKWEQNFLNPSPISDFISSSLLCSHFFIFPFPVLVTSHETVLISRFLEDVFSGGCVIHMLV